MVTVCWALKVTTVRLYRPVAKLHSTLHNFILFQCRCFLAAPCIVLSPTLYLPLSFRAHLIWTLQIEEAHKPSYHVQVAVRQEIPPLPPLTYRPLKALPSLVRSINKSVVRLNIFSQQSVQTRRALRKILLFEKMT